MLKGISNKEVVEVSCEKDVTNPTIFLVGSLTQGEGISLFTDCLDSKGNPDMKKIDPVKVFKAGCKGIKNFSFNGEEAKDYVPASDEVLSSVQPLQVMEIFARIMSFNFPSEGEGKN